MLIHKKIYVSFAYELSVNPTLLYIKESVVNTLNDIKILDRNL